MIPHVRLLEYNQRCQAVGGIYYGICWECDKKLSVGCRFFELSMFDFRVITLMNAKAYKLKFCDTCFISLAGKEYIVDFPE